MLFATTASDIFDWLAKFQGFWAIAGGSVLGAAGWLTATFRKVTSLTKTCDDLKGAVDRIESIMNKELTYNGGKSMKDVLDSVVSSQNRTEAWNTALLNQSSAPMWRADPKGNIEWANAAFTRTTGYGLEHLSESRWLDMVCEEDRSHVSESWDHAVQTGRSFCAEFLTSPGDTASDLVVMQAHPFFAAHKQGGQLLGFNGTLTIQQR